jgi:hypothetical protein
MDTVPTTLLKPSSNAPAAMEDYEGRQDEQEQLFVHSVSTNLQPVLEIRFPKFHNFPPGS